MMVSKNMVKTVNAMYCRNSEQTEEPAVKSLFKELGGAYHQDGDHLYLICAHLKVFLLVFWGQQRRHYLRTQRGALYDTLLLSGKLDDHLVKINTQAETLFFQLVKQLAEQEGITEQLKI